MRAGWLFIEKKITIGMGIATKISVTMNLSDLARQIGAQLFPPGGKTCPGALEVHASDTMSSLIANASHDTLLVTSLNNNQLIRVAELMDAPGLCLVGGAQPNPQLLARARETGAVIMVSPLGLEETRRRLEEYLAADRAGQGPRLGAGRGAGRA
jgi:hypothetical protein